MSKLDDIKPTGHNGLYKVEIQVEGEWVSVALVNMNSIIALTDSLDEYSDADCETAAQDE